MSGHLWFDERVSGDALLDSSPLPSPLAGRVQKYISVIRAYYDHDPLRVKFDAEDAKNKKKVPE